MTLVTELFGTEEPLPARRLLGAGALTAVLEAGNLRYIRWAGVELLRAVNYLARDTSWGTYAAVLTDVAVTETDGAFLVTYSGRCEGPEGRFDYAMEITGRADGTLTLQASGAAITPFPTNRVGFVLLHPAEVAGSPLRIEHSDGTTRDTRFPELVDPDPPALDIAAMTHRPAPALTVRVAMQGDAFEMEDQRNWSDASFKTFVRPLSRPRPYTIPQGGRDVQSVTVSVTGPGVAAPGGARVTGGLRIGPEVGTMPRMALFCDRESALAGDAALLGRGIANLLVPRWRADGPPLLADAARLARAIEAEIAVEAIMPARSPGAETPALMAALKAAGLTDATLLIAPEREFRTSATGTLPVGEVTCDELVRALRAAGHRGRIGAGTPSYFPEFNRNPPGTTAEFVYFGGAATIHAADDASVVETIGVTPIMLATARHRVDRPIWFGPCTLAMRHTPYGAGLAPNPLRIRMLVTDDDPRHFALFGAAYAVGIAAQVAGRVECLTLAAPFGHFGLLNDGRPTALCAVQRLLTGAAGMSAFAVQTGPEIAALGWVGKGARTILMANLSPDRQTIDLPDGATMPAMLTAGGQWEPTDVRGTGVTLPPYRTLRFDLP